LSRVDFFRRGSFLFSRNFFLFFLHLWVKRLAKPQKRKNFLSRVYVRAIRREYNNSLELFIFFYRNTLVFLFIKRKVSEEMPFSSEVFRIYSDNFRKNGNNFGRKRDNFGSYCYKWGSNFARKMLKKRPFLRGKKHPVFCCFQREKSKREFMPFSSEEIAITSERMAITSEEMCIIVEEMHQTSEELPFNGEEMGIKGEVILIIHQNEKCRA